MSTVLLRQRLEAEEASLAMLLARAAATDLLGKVSLEGRLRSVRKEIEQLSQARATRAELALVFNGKPVTGASAIKASFGTRAIDGFQRAVSTTFALQASEGQVGQRGPIPNSDLADLHITGVVHGSFGFVLEELDPRGEQWTDSALKNATTRVLEVIAKVSAPESADAESALEDINDRLFVNIRDWIKLSHESEATVTISSPEYTAELDRETLRRAYDRVAETDISDQELMLRGMLQGVLPEGRRFEFVTEQQRIIGRVARGISEEYLRTLETDPIVGQPITALFRKRTVVSTTSATRETYTLLRLIPDEGLGSHLT